MKLLSLILINLKGFFRNWMSILLLIIFPLVLIGLVFFSFNPDGMQKVPVGFVGETQGIDLASLEDTYLSYLKISHFTDLQSCLHELKEYRQYACLEISNGNKLEVYYDNTKEPIIWEILERLKSSIDYLKKAKSTEMAGVFLNDFSVLLNKIDTFKSGVFTAEDQISVYIVQTDQTISELQQAKGDLGQTIYQMDQDIREAKATRNDLKNQKDSVYYTGINYANNVDSQLNSMTNITGYDLMYMNNIRTQSYNLRSTFNSYNDQSEAKFAEFDQKIVSYEAASRKGKDQLVRIDQGISKARNVRDQLSGYRTNLQKTENELTQVQSEFGGIAGLDAETLVEPITMHNTPTYVPEVSAADAAKYGTDVKNIFKGINLISLQTIYPIILLLITFFLALLISSFLSLAEINSPAHERVMLVKGMFWNEFFALFLSAVIIISIPLLCVLALGNYLFNIGIMNNIGLVILICFLLSSIFILLGISLAYLLKKESTTLLICTFILVFLIFFSGFILPIERMSYTPSIIAEHLPGKIALNAFNQAVFYSQPIDVIAPMIHALLAWSGIMVLIALTIKKVKKV
jgi:hypothetical protein